MPTSFSVDLGVGFQKTYQFAGGLYNRFADFRIFDSNGNELLKASEVNGMVFRNEPNGTLLVLIPAVDIDAVGAGEYTFVAKTAAFGGESFEFDSGDFVVVDPAPA